MTEIIQKLQGPAFMHNPPLVETVFSLIIIRYHVLISRRCLVPVLRRNDGLIKAIERCDSLARPHCTLGGACKRHVSCKCEV